MMLETIILTIIMLLATMIGYAISSAILSPKEGLKENVATTLIYLTISNLILSNTYLLDKLWIKIVVVALVSLTSISLSVLLVRIIFGKEKKEDLIKEDKCSKKLIMLARALNESVTKEEIIKAFKRAKINNTLVNHINRTLKE